MISPGKRLIVKTGLKAGLFLLAALIVFAINGCVNDYENNSYIPQNRPADWEIRPYGDMRN